MNQYFQQNGGNITISGVSDDGIQVSYETDDNDVIIDEAEIQAFDAETMTIVLRIVCSKGTYIRALARDIGQALDSGAHLTALQRTRIGQYTLSDCLRLEQLTEWLSTNELTARQA